MMPTAKLRFVQRKIVQPSEHYENTSITIIAKILQQWWEAEGWEHEDLVKAEGEWRDVPLETGEQA